MEETPLVFHQREHWLHPAAKLYEVEGPKPGAEPSQREVYLTTEDSIIEVPPATGSALDSPLATTGPLTFLGYTVSSKAEHITLETFWAVMEVTGRPLSLMAHLIDGAGTTVAIADGLSVPIESWEPGDVIVQHHIFETDNEDTSYVLTGGYWLDTMARWKVGASTNGVLIPVKP